MTIRWLVSLPNYKSALFAASFSAWQPSYHLLHASEPSSEIGAYQMLRLAETHGYFSIRVDERSALRSDPNTNVPGLVHALMNFAPNPAAGTHVTDTEPRGTFGFLGSMASSKATKYTQTFPLTVTILKDEKKDTVTVGSVYFQSVKVTGFVTATDGYIFGFMVTDKFRENF